MYHKCLPHFLWMNSFTLFGSNKVTHSQLGPFLVPILTFLFCVPQIAFWILEENLLLPLSRSFCLSIGFFTHSFLSVWTNLLIFWVAFLLVAWHLSLQSWHLVLFWRSSSVMGGDFSGLFHLSYPMFPHLGWYVGFCLQCK